MSEDHAYDLPEVEDAPDATIMTPEQAVKHFRQQPTARQIQIMTHHYESGDRALKCMMRDHESELASLKARNAQLELQVVDLQNRLARIADLLRRTL
jgi:cell division protein FtsB